ncbi:uncharacterized protein LOC120169652 isoform X2 [Hibiscus syriacus]|uniref:uncharacterized protein LOC120169652 isoform X2 n=1 Tax=Hibiscus syriacus TaxID=106335 RepID=UPI00192372A6|nr:uncharacterized protein LOC120169652 isoform X2 [Hibiscus syriacus]
MVGGRTGAPATHRAHGTSCGDHSFASLLHLPVRNCVSSKHDHHQQARYSVEPSGLWSFLAGHCSRVGYSKDHVDESNEVQRGFPTDVQTP